MTRLPVLVSVASTCVVILSAATPVVFTDVTEQAGIRFAHTTGAFGAKYMPETFGSGVLWLDVDADGWQDILFVNGTAWPERDTAAAHAALYRNDGDGTFTDITRGSGLDRSLYGMGGTAADFDNDGHVDVYLTALGPNRLFKGHGDGTFEDVTATAGVGDPGFSTSALWFDYDKDGHLLDLFVGNYVEWSPDADLFCSLVGDTKSYCTPESYQGQSPTLYRNRGDQTFEDVTTPRRAARPVIEGARCRDARRRWRRLDGSVRDQRHPAQPTVSESRRRHLRGRRSPRRRGIQRDGRGTRGDGSGRRRL